MPNRDNRGLTKDTLFKPNPSRMEARNAVTDKTAKAILQKEHDDMETKTQRLRAARLNRDQAD